jgi:hypothetical protein
MGKQPLLLGRFGFPVRRVINCIPFPTPVRESESQADYVVDSFAELERLLGFE